MSRVMQRGIKMLSESEICEIVCPETQCKKRCSDYDRFVRVCEAQHKADQEEFQEIIKEIEVDFVDIQGTVWQLNIAKFRWQELKHKWGIE